MKPMKLLLKAIGIISVSSFGFSTSFFALQSPSSAQSSLRFICNKTVFMSVSVAIGYQDGVSAGWFNIEPSRCLLVKPHEVHGIATHFYGKSKLSNLSNRWFGDKSRSFCVFVPQRFEIDSRGGCFNGAESRTFGTIGSGMDLKL
jgi:uncharacterized membrane protein